MGILSTDHQDIRIRNTIKKFDVRIPVMMVWMEDLSRYRIQELNRDCLAWTLNIYAVFMFDEKTCITRTMCIAGVIRAMRMTDILEQV